MPPVDPKDPRVSTPPPVAVPLPGDAGKPAASPPPAAPTQVPADSAAATQLLRAVEQGGVGRRFRPNAILPTGYLGDLAGDLGALLRAAGADIQVPKVAQDLIKVPSRGGVMVKTSAGWIQLGLPMWTNKDAFGAFAGQGGFTIPKDEMPERLPHMIPLVYVVDTDYVKNYLAADFIQYMFFVTKGTTFTLVAPNAQGAADMTRFLDLSYEGPRSAELSASVAAEYPPNARGVPDMLAELTRGFGGSPPSAALRNIQALNGEGVYAFKDVEVRKIGPMRYEVVDRRVSLGVVDLADYPLPAMVNGRNQSAALDPELQAVRQQVLVEGRAGIWAFGTGHGFVPNEDTSGFMIWNKGRFVMVDPPSNTVDYLISNGIPLEAAEGVILTHGHTDHYGDALPKLLRIMPQLKVHTTPTIFSMLQEQYRLAVGGKNEGLNQWNFVPVKPQSFTDILGLHFRFEYGFHTVPTIGFEVHVAPDLKSAPIFFFSGDTFADHAAIWPHTKPGPNGESPVMSMARAMAVTRHRDFIMGSRGNAVPIVGLIEAGIPPIHTDPASTREILDAAAAAGVDVSRIRVYHIAQAAADAAGVPKWKAGHVGFMDLSPSLPNFTPGSEQDYAKRLLERMPLLDALDENLRHSLLRYGNLIHVEAGQKLLTQGPSDQMMYILVDGEVHVSHNGDVIASRPNGMFGEAALLGEPRNADVTTTVPSLVLAVDVQDLPTRIIHPLRVALQRIRLNRADGNYDAVKKLSPLAGLPDAILDVLFLKGDVRKAAPGQRFVTEGGADQDVYIVLEGQVHVSKADGSLAVDLDKGTLLGEMAMVDGATRRASVDAGEGGVSLLHLPPEAMRELSVKYPGIAIALSRTAEDRRASTTGAVGESDSPFLGFYSAEGCASDATTGPIEVAKPPRSERGFATAEVALTPFYALQAAANHLSEYARQTATHVARGGAIFFLGDKLSGLVMGEKLNLNPKDVALDYGALTAGNVAGEAVAAKVFHVSAKSLLGRAIPLFSALTALDFSHTGKVNLAQLPVSAGNVLVASGIVSVATGAMAASEKVLNFGKVMRLVSLGGKATFLGAVVTSAAEFTIIKALNQVEARVAESGAFAEVTLHIGQLLSADAQAIELLSHGQAVPAEYLTTIDQQLAIYEQGLANRPGLAVRQIEASFADTLTALRRDYEADVSRRLDGTWSRAEVTEEYDARRRNIEDKRGAALAAARAQEDHRFTRLAVTPGQVADQLLDTVDEDAFKADVEMDGNPVHSEKTLQYQSVLARDWAGLSAQIAQYRRDRVEVIRRYQRQLPPKVELPQLAMND